MRKSKGKKGSKLVIARATTRLSRGSRCGAVAEAAEIAALERPPGALEHGAARGGGAARQGLVRRDDGLVLPAPAADGIRTGADLAIPDAAATDRAAPARFFFFWPPSSSGSAARRSRSPRGDELTAGRWARGRRPRGAPRQLRRRGRGRAGGRAGGCPWRLVREPSPVRRISGDVATLALLHGRWAAGPQGAGSARRRACC
jgi:hypothetical protein